MAIRVYLPSPLRRFTGGAGRVEIDEPECRTVGDVLDALERRWPGILANVRDAQGEVRTFVNIFKNGTEIRQLEGLHSPVQPGDEVSIIPAMAGGDGRHV